jgi:hypothetical protein
MLFEKLSKGSFSNYDWQTTRIQYVMPFFPREFKPKIGLNKLSIRYNSKFTTK